MTVARLGRHTVVLALSNHLLAACVEVGGSHTAWHPHVSASALPQSHADFWHSQLKQIPPFKLFVVGICQRDRKARCINGGTVVLSE